MLKSHLVASLIMAGAVSTLTQAQAAPPPERTDYLTFAAGALPTAVGGEGAGFGASFEEAISAIDGNPGLFSLFVRPAPASAATEFVYRLPAATTFSRFAVPSVSETPSPRQTFSKHVEVHGSATGPTEGFRLLASATLVTHKTRNQVTELTIASRTPVRWVKLRLVGGIQVTEPATHFEFTEIIGNGTQEDVRMSDRFSGAWQARGVLIGLKQEGAIVSGCFDDDGVLNGTVAGEMLRATGVAQRTKVKSAFLLSVKDDGSITGLRSTNGAPFRRYDGGTAAASVVKCLAPPKPVLGCGSVIHGINFDYDSHVIRPDSEPVLSMLFAGLKDDPKSAVVIEGHTSSEGTAEYNQALSQRRAQSVVADLTRRGIPSGRLKAAGLGESRPIAGNHDESGRSLNRRVEVKCN